MRNRFGGVLDYSRLLPEAQPAVPDTDIAERARQMHEAGHGLHDIACILGAHPEQVRRWIASIAHGEAAA